MQNLVISPKVRQKLETKHKVSEREVEQCFYNRCGLNLIDTREDHQTDPPSLWFIAETDLGRLLKIVFVCDGGKVFLKSAYEPEQASIDIYEKLGR
ncbi:ADP-ribosyl-(dinitrogen reductase) hydrolase [Ralstonia wenshanensis]|uniref:ADP-ribosyl-(Dinitrogen reductase) hydrolase n=1 Tax=Ralstonia wenshanensis TaxID=2842456 RepID=A0AAD2ESH3_9RALS|nr:ADP-ribosyl-(dinitrogen reductase) hydrolase [Ralstonia wenshanensis]CAJ0699305.1 hypothetical protein LMG18091_02900 [Ralstonia wenshanensis]